MESAIIFDNDGVIIDSEPLHIEADLLTLQSYGIELQPEALHRFIGVKDLEMWRILKEELALPNSPEVLREKKEQLRDRIFLPERLVPIPGIPELFETVRRAGWKIAVASSSARTLIGPWLQLMGLMSFLDAFVTGEDVRHGKPHPEPYQLAAARLGLLPEDCVAVEDSPHGVASAKNAGCRCIGFRTPGGPHQDLSGADHIISDICEILRDDLLGLNAGNRAIGQTSR